MDQLRKSIKDSIESYSLSEAYSSVGIESPQPLSKVHSQASSLNSSPKKENPLKTPSTKKNGAAKKLDVK